MEKIQFKTNLQCGGCVAAVRNRLDEAIGAEHWQVDLQSMDRLLEAEISVEKIPVVIEAVQGAGFEIEQVSAL